VLWKQDPREVKGPREPLLQEHQIRQDHDPVPETEDLPNRRGEGPEAPRLGQHRFGKSATGEVRGEVAHVRYEHSAEIVAVPVAAGRDGELKRRIFYCGSQAQG